MRGEERETGPHSTRSELRGGPHTSTTAESHSITIKNEEHDPIRQYSKSISKIHICTCIQYTVHIIYNIHNTKKNIHFRDKILYLFVTDCIFKIQINKKFSYVFRQNSILTWCREIWYKFISQYVFIEQIIDKSVYLPWKSNIIHSKRKNKLKI